MCYFGAIMANKHRWAGQVMRMNGDTTTNNLMTKKQDGVGARGKKKRGRFYITRFTAHRSSKLKNVIRKPTEKAAWCSVESAKHHF